MRSNILKTRKRFSKSFSNNIHAITRAGFWQDAKKRSQSLQHHIRQSNLQFQYKSLATKCQNRDNIIGTHVLWEEQKKGFISPSRNPIFKYTQTLKYLKKTQKLTNIIAKIKSENNLRGTKWCKLWGFTISSLQATTARRSDSGPPEDRHSCDHSRFQNSSALSPDF